MDTERTSNFSARDLLHVVFKRKFHVLAFLSVAVCAVTFYSFSTELTYKATGKLLMKLGRENIFMPTIPGRTIQNPVVFNRGQLNSAIEILQSQYLIEAVVESLGPATIYDDLDGSSREAQTLIATDNLLGNLEVLAVEDSNVISVSFQHTDSRMAATVVNTLMNRFLDRHLEVHKTPQSYAFFGEQSQIWKNALQQAQGKLETFKKEHNLTADLEEERSLILQQEAALRADLNQTLSLEAETENRLRNPVPDDRLLSRLVELELKEQELLTKYTDESRFVQSVRDEIQVVRRALSEQQNTRYQAEMKALRARKESQRAELAKYQKRLEELKRIEMEFYQLKHEVEVNRENYNLYLTKLEESRVSNAMDTERIASVSLIEPATPPRRPQPRRMTRNMLLSILLGGVGGLGLAFFSESLDNSLEKIEDVESHLHIPVLASIPEMKS